MTKYVRRDISEKTPERQQGNPMADPTAKGLGPPIKVTDVQRFDAVRAVEKRRQLDHETYAEAGVLLGALGLLPAATHTGPLAVACPACCAAPGSACTTLGSRKRFTGTHKAREAAA